MRKHYNPSVVIERHASRLNVFAQQHKITEWIVQRLITVTTFGEERKM